MAEDITFVVHKEWLDSIQALPVEQQDKILSDIVRYGTESELMHEDDPIVFSFVNLLRGRIDYSKDKYSEKIEMSKTAGRKRKVDNCEIYRLAQQGYTSGEIANLLGCSKSSVDHSEGWKSRKQKSFENEDKVGNDVSNIDFVF